VTLGKRAPSPVPDATISTDAETYAQVVAKVIPAPQAFFAGKIKLVGDVGLAMQLATSMMGRFA
jgi:putative sterol carrier protein